jgi:peroxiredoxin Q/BCP
VIGVSADTQEKNDDFCRSLELPFPLVGDPQGRITRAYGVRIPLLGLARRVTYLVGRDRRVRLAFESQFNVGAHLARVREALAAAA